MSDEEPEMSEEEGEEGEEEEYFYEDEGEEFGEQFDEGEGEGEVEEVKVPPKPLTLDIVSKCLSLLCKTGDGLAHAYVKMDIQDKAITDIDMLKTFIHLRYVNVSKNNLKDISPLSFLTNMLTLNADGNLLTKVNLSEMPYLQVASFQNNRIQTTEGINHPMLEHLNLNYNFIKHVTSLDASKLTKLHTLEMRGNKLDTTDGIYLPYLRNLFLAENVIKRIEGMSRLKSLQTLHLRNNQVESLDGFTEDQTSLQYINLRGNLVASVKESSKLKVLSVLRALVLSENPCAEEDDYRLETLIGIRTLERLDKDEYTDEERLEAEEIGEQRRIEEEEKANLEAKILAEIQEVQGLGMEEEDVLIEDEQVKLKSESKETVQEEEEVAAAAEDAGAEEANLQEESEET